MDIFVNKKAFDSVVGELKIGAEKAGYLEQRNVVICNFVVRCTCFHKFDPVQLLQ